MAFNSTDNFVECHIFLFHEPELKNGIYNTATIDTLKQLTKVLQKMDEIEKADVTSLYTADNIVGDERGMCGRYEDNSMIYTKIKYNF